MNEVKELKEKKYSHIQDWDDNVIELAINLHNTYEVISKEENWKTQESTHLKPFKNLPIENQRVMLRIADFILKTQRKDIEKLRSEFKQLKVFQIPPKLVDTIINQVFKIEKEESK
jgi:uncharacterized membrane protein